MKKLILAGAVAALMIPAAAFAQDADVQMNGAAGAAGGAMQSETGAMGTTGTMSGDTMNNDVTGSTTADPTGSYTIVTKTSAEAQGTTTGQDANRNTDPMAVQKTIDANPGLAEKLQAEGIEMDDIGSISVGANGIVTVYSKS